MDTGLVVAVLARGEAIAPGGVGEVLPSPLPSDVLHTDCKIFSAPYVALRGEPQRSLAPLAEDWANQHPRVSAEP